ncbi:MAG: hypothetical protein U0174_04410 [Polyangiaceae bacterium]
MPFLSAFQSTPAMEGLFGVALLGLGGGPSGVTRSARVIRSLVAVAFLAASPGFAMRSGLLHPAASASAFAQDLFAYLWATSVIVFAGASPSAKRLLAAAALGSTVLMSPSSRTEAPALLALALALPRGKLRHLSMALWLLAWLPGVRASWEAYGVAHTFEDAWLRCLRATFPACVFVPVVLARFSTRVHEAAPEPLRPLGAFFCMALLRGPQHPVVLLVPLATLLALYVTRVEMPERAHAPLAGVFVAAVFASLVRLEFTNEGGQGVREFFPASASSTPTSSVAPSASNVVLGVMMAAVAFALCSVAASAFLSPPSNLRVRFRQGAAGLVALATLAWSLTLSARFRRQTGAGAIEYWRETRGPKSELFATPIARQSMAASNATPSIVAKEGGPASWISWLDSAGESEPWMVASKAELAQLSFEYRKRHGRNLPIGYADDAFVVFRRRPPAGAGSPLDEIVGSTERTDLRGTRAEFEGGITALGVSLEDLDRKALSAAPRGTFRIVTHFRVSAAQHGGYCTFLHIDHAPSRYAAEHRELAYPMAFWMPGDVISDAFEVNLPPHFRTGSYAVYYGLGQLPCEDDRRMGVRGRPDGRVYGGQLVVP